MINAAVSMACGSMFLFSAAARAEGTHGAGNGGDLVECKASAENAFNGVYALDYLLTYRKPGPKGQLAEVKDWPTSAERILKLLKEKSPRLARGFQDFAGLVENQTSYGAARIWEPASFGLIDIKDENMLNLLPANCRGLQKTGDHSLIQGVIRSPKGEKIFYQYDEDRIARLKKAKALQYSFLMVHEWLWDLTDDVQLIRKVNRLLHSTDFEAMSEFEFRHYLNDIGVIKTVTLQDGVYASQESTSCAQEVVRLGGNRFRMNIVNHPRRHESCLWVRTYPMTCQYESWADGTVCLEDGSAINTLVVQSETSFSGRRDPSPDEVYKRLD